MQNCPVCLDDKPLTKFQRKYSSRCRHAQRSICDDCVYGTIQSAFSKMCTDNVRCPELSCGIRLSYKNVRKILSEQNDRVLLDKYERFVLHRELEKMTEFIWCAHGCGMGQLNEGENGNNIVTCVKCRRRTCFNHKTEWHTGLTCDQYDRQQNADVAATHRWIAQHSRKCPKCIAPIEKDDGCDHMTCLCGYQFCWSCLADYDRIRRDGNHRHESTCKHYAAYHRA